MTRGLRAWLPVAAWATLIFVASARPTVPVGLGGGLDKVAHLSAYLVLGFLLARALPIPRAAILLGWAYALSDEIHQRFVPGRTFEVADWIADAVGVLLGVLAFHWWRRRAARWARPGAVIESFLS